MMQETLLLRTASAALRPEPKRFANAIARVQDFLKRNQDPYVIERDLEELLASAETDGLVYIERVVDGELVAVAGAFPKNKDTVTSPVYLELGATIVHRDYRGFGLHKVLQQVRLLRLYLLHHESLVVFTCAKTGNYKSSGSLIKTGFAETCDPSILKLKPSTEGRRFYYFPLDRMPEVARAFLDRKTTYVHRSRRYPDEYPEVDDRELELLLEPEIKQRSHMFAAIRDLADDDRDDGPDDP